MDTSSPDRNLAEILDDYKMTNGTLLFNVGYLLHQDDSVTILSSSMGVSPGPSEETRWRDSMHIPTSLVRKIETLRKASR